MATLFDNITAYTPAPSVDEEAALHNAQINERYRMLREAEAGQLEASVSAAEKEAEAARARVSAPVRTEESAYVPTAAYSAPAYEPSVTPTAERAEQVFVHTRVDSPLFTPEMLDKTLRRETYDYSSLYEDEDDEFVAAKTYPTAAAYETFENILPVGVSSEKELHKEAPAFEAVASPAPVPTPTATVAPTVAVAHAPEAVAAPVAAESTAVKTEVYGLSAFAVKMIVAFAALVVALFTVIGVNSALIRAKTARLNDLEETRTRLQQESEELSRLIAEATDPEYIAQWALEHGMILGE